MDLIGFAVIVFLGCAYWTIYKVVLRNPRLTDMQRMWALLVVLLTFFLCIVGLLAIIE